MRYRTARPALAGVASSCRVYDVVVDANDRLLCRVLGQHKKGLVHGCRFLVRYKAAEKIDAYVLRIYNPFGWNEASRSKLRRSRRRTTQ